MLYSTCAHILRRSGLPFSAESAKSSQSRFFPWKFLIRSWESAAHVLGDHEEPHNSRVGSQCAQGPRRATQLRGKTFLGTSSLQAEGLHTKRIVWKLTLQRFVERRPLCHCLLSTFIDQIDVPKLSFPSNQPYQKLYRSYQNFQSQKSFH